MRILDASCYSSNTISVIRVTKYKMKLKISYPIITTSSGENFKNSIRTT